jgi:predicted outer membrane protein
MEVERVVKPGTNLSVAALITALTLGATPVAAHAQGASATDLDFVRRVHLTALSVGPAGALARTVSAHAAVRALAAQVVSQDAQLDRRARAAAGALKVSLTGALPAAQQAALTSLQAHTGAVFETQFVNYLWAADSTLLPISMTVHATTANAAVRELADRADSVVAAQLPLLQKSGLLQMAVLPAPPASTSATTRLPGGVPMNQSLAAQARSGGGFLSPTLPVRLLVLAAALCAAGVLTWRLRTAPARRRGRRRAESVRRTGPTPQG